MKQRPAVLFLISLCATLLSACQTPNPYTTASIPASEIPPPSYHDDSIDYNRYHVWRWADGPMRIKGISPQELQQMTEQQLTLRGMSLATPPQEADFIVQVSTNAQHHSQPITVRSTSYNNTYGYWNNGFYPRIYPTIGGYYHRHGHWRPGVGIGLGLPFFYPDAYPYSSYRSSSTRPSGSYKTTVNTIRISFIDAKTGQGIWYSEAEYPWRDDQFNHAREIGNALTRALSTYPTQ